MTSILPEKMAQGYGVLSLFDERDRVQVRNAFKECELEPGPFATVYSKTITTITSLPNSFPARHEYNCVISYGGGVFNMLLVPTQDSSPNREADELRDFFNKAPIALHWLSDEGRVLWANDRELEVLEYTRAEYIGEDIMKFCPDSAEKVLAIFKELGSGNTIRDVPVRFRTKSGKIKDLLIDSNVNYKRDGSFNHTRCFIRDDTGRKIREARAEVLLQESQRLVRDKGRFVAKLLHEIKTPLHVMSMAMALVQKQCEGCGEKDQFIKTQTAHLSRLVSNMSSAMRFDDGLAPSEHMVTCDLVDFFENYAKPSFLTKPVDTVLDMKGGVGSVVIDTKKLTIVLDELLVFCEEVAFDGGSLQVTVTQHEQSGEYTIEVSCVGEVLDNATIQKVFHSYWLDSSSTDQPLHTDTPGLNLGLNIAFNNVQCMQSDLSVESTAEQTCFSFTLKPESTDNLNAEPDVHTTKPPQGIGLNDCASLHVLIVEDNTICQKMCKRLLEKLGHMCSVAGNGAVAVDMITGPECVIYDAVLMDIRMPIMNGIEATAKITQHLTAHQIRLPIVALTAEDNFEGVGFSSVLKKPIGIADIAQVLAQVLAQNTGH